MSDLDPLPKGWDDDHGDPVAEFIGWDDVLNFLNVHVWDYLYNDAGGDGCDNRHYTVLLPCVHMAMTAIEAEISGWDEEQLAHAQFQNVRELMKGLDTADPTLEAARSQIFRLANAAASTGTIH